MTSSNRIVLLILIPLFFLSGCAGLIYESIWSHYLKLFVGHAAYAQTLVLVIYMGGMALGSWLASHFTRRIKNLLLWYAAAEIVIGFTALVFHPIFVRYLALSYDAVFPALNSALMISLYKWITAPLLILPQTILLGATFPLIAGGIIRLDNNAPGRTIAVLYFVNSLGGSIGILLSGFYLIEKCTFPGTVQCAGIIDLVAGGGVLVLCLLTAATGTAKTAAVKINKHQVTPPPRQPMDSAVRTLLIVSGATAASSFMYEVGWIRMLSLVLGSSTHSFELMLSAFILGLAIGGFWIKNRLDTIDKPMTALAIIQIAMGACAIATLFFYGKLFYLMEFFMNSLSKTDQGYVMFHIYSHLICLLVMLPATILAGMTLPLITFYLYNKNTDESVIGKVYAFNTIGSIIGVLIAIQVLMPLVGLMFLLISGGVIDMLIGLYLIRRFKEHSSRSLPIVLAGITLIMTAIPSIFVHLDPTLLSSGVFRYGRITKKDQMVYYRDGKTSSVSLLRRADSYMLANNGKTDATVSFDTTKVGHDEYTQILLAAYPLTYSRKCHTAGIIGLGSGMTASVLLESDSIRHIDVVEIEPRIVEAARLMGPKVRKVFNDKRSSIHIDDAKTFFSANNKKYDLIISEPSNPWVSGVASLFTVEFFDRITKHLDNGGMLAQWFHLYEMNTELISSILKSIDRCFLDYKAFICGPDLIILASNSPIADRPGDQALKTPAIAAMLRAADMEHDYDFHSNYIGGKTTLTALAQMCDVPVNSDFNPILDLRAVKARILNSTAAAFSEMSRYIIPVRKLIENDTAASVHVMTGRNIQSDNYFTININEDYEAWQAWLYITSLGTARESFADSAVAKRVALKAAMVRMAARDSSAAAHQMWPKYAFDLLKITMPYLPPLQMADIWNYIDGEGAAIALPPQNRDILTVLRNISFRKDFETTRSLSRGLLGKGQIRASDYNRMLVAAFLVSSMKVNKYDGIRGVWENVGDMKYDHNLLMIYKYSLDRVQRR